MDGSQEGSGGERSDREKEAWASTTATVHACDPAAIFGAPRSFAYQFDMLRCYGTVSLGLHDVT